MSNNTAEALKVIDGTLPTKQRKPYDQFQDRHSQELVLAFSGPVGSGVDLVVEEAKKTLLQIGYTVTHIKLSDLISKLSSKGFTGEIDLTDVSKQDKYPKLQAAGNFLRQKHGNDFLAEIAINKIAVTRTSNIPDNEEIDTYVPERTAYLIDQLKHPDEVILLRTVYSKLFYLIGVFSSHDQSKKRLCSNLSLSETLASTIMDNDKKENDTFGQQLEKTLKLADLFIRNSSSQNDKIKYQLFRFLRLLHGEIGITPTNHEHAMYVAYSAGLRSACLSRQVGAAITDKHGNIISTGCNDVPKAGGGLYNETDSKDARCVKIEGGKCFNNYYKDLFKDKIQETLSKHMDSVMASKLAAVIKKESGLNDLLEYSRSVHAEMDAIITAARLGSTSIAGGYIYTTTYPCHHCARHIISSGINKVFYIEPYEKSLAKELHSDAIAIDPEEENPDIGHVKFLHFEGISPRQYQYFFYPSSERKDSAGKAMSRNIAVEGKIINELLDDYRSLESRVTDYLKSNLEIPEDLLSS